MGLFNGRKTVSYMLMNVSSGNFATVEEMEKTMVCAHRVAERRGMHPSDFALNKRQNGLIFYVDGGGSVEVTSSLTPAINYDLPMSKSKISEFCNEVYDEAEKLYNICYRVR